MTTRFRLLLAATAALSLIGPSALAADHEEGAGDINGLMVGGEFAYTRPNGHDYNNQLDDGLDALHLYVGYRFLGLASFEVGLLEVQAPIKSSSKKAEIRTLSLDGRIFIPLGSFQPNFLVGYSPSAEFHASDSGIDQKFHGNSWILGAGARFVVVPKFYLTLDVRHSFIRYQKGDITIAGVTVSGTLDSEARGDVTAVLVGGGVQF